MALGINKVLYRRLGRSNGKLSIRILVGLARYVLKGNWQGTFEDGVGCKGASTGSGLSTQTRGLCSTFQTRSPRDRSFLISSLKQ